MFSYYSSVSGSGVSVTFFIMFFNVFVKWYIIYTVFLLSVQSPICLIDIVSVIVIYALLLCVIHTVSCTDVV